MNITSLHNGLNGISDKIGVLHHLIKLPRMNMDPLMVNYGVLLANVEFLSSERYAGKGAGCSFEWEDAVLGAICETLERYAASFYNLDESLFSSFNNLHKHAIHPKEFALFHKEQLKDKTFKINEFTNDIELTWFKTIDLTNGKVTWLPGQFIYLPFSHDKNYITVNTSTGLAAHTNYYKAILTGLYEAIERDSFVLTWLQNLVPSKIRLSKGIHEYIDNHFPVDYEWHFFDISYDIHVPSVLGFCFGEAEYGKFIAVGASTRATYAEALKKTIQEIGQSVPYFRYLLNIKKGWNPSDNYSLIKNFEDHSIFYVQRPDLWHVFDKWVNAIETKNIDFFEENDRTDRDQVKHIVKIMKDKNYNVLFKDITTCDVRQLGFFSVKIFIPQLMQLSGAYDSYFLGGNRLYNIPQKTGYKSNDYNKLNKYPHPFP